mgnify:CR=1 FL=1
MLRNDIPGFAAASALLDGTRIAYESAGSGPPLLMLHGFPQTRAMWAEVAPTLARDFTVICPDLRGYGESDKPRGVASYSFREMARDQLALMRHLGHETFHLVGHDRGARTAHRLALDAPEAVRSLTVMDIVPTHHLLTELTHEVAKGYYHWFFLAQPEPFPETMIGHDPDAARTATASALGVVDARVVGQPEVVVAAKTQQALAIHQHLDALRRLQQRTLTIQVRSTALGQTGGKIEGHQKAPSDKQHASSHSRPACGLQLMA